MVWQARGIKDIELGCDDEHGGVLCNTCGQNSNNQGANGLIHQADDVIDATRQTLELKIYQARKFIDSVSVIVIWAFNMMD